jgi:hypothetical protein
MNIPGYNFGKGFPNQFASNKEKDELEYGLRVALAIEHEWFSRDHSTNFFGEARSEYLRRRAYARGEQNIEKYKNELSVNGDLSYLNLDWTPVPIVSKFVDIVANGINQRLFDVKAEAIDELSTAKKEEFERQIRIDMKSMPLRKMGEEILGIKTPGPNEEELPQNSEELDLYMQIGYKNSIEIAQETAVNAVLDINDFDEIKKRTDEDAVVLGISAIRHDFDLHDGVRLEYVDPLNLVYSPTDDPSFEDCYYFGEVKSIHVTELKKINPDMSNEELDELARTAGRHDGYLGLQNTTSASGMDKQNVTVLYFCYKTDRDIVYKVKKTAVGGEKSLRKDSDFQPPKTEQARFKKVSRKIDVWYEGVYVLGTNKIMKWELMKNMVRPKSAFQKTIPPYVVHAPKMTRGTIDSLVKRMIPFADQIQLIHLKIQQVVQKMIPDGVFIDADGLNSVDLGNGNSYNPAEALSMYFQTGSVVGRSYTEDGDFNNARVPIQELSSSGSNAKLASLITAYDYQLNMLRSVTGINEARDGSMPDRYALPGIQKLAALNSNVATRHVLDSGITLSRRICEALSYRISDIMEFADFAEDFATMIGKNNTKVVREIRDVHLHDFGIYIEVEPDEEEKNTLEQSIQTALGAGMIDLDDAIDIRSLNNLKLANTMLKLRKQRRVKAAMEQKQAQIEMQTQSNVQSAQAASQARMQEEQMKVQAEGQMAQLKAELETQQMIKKAEIEKEMLALKYHYETQLKQLESDSLSTREAKREDRKDKRTEIQATQQSKMIDQRKKGLPAINFEKQEMNPMMGMNQMMTPPMPGMNQSMGNPMMNMNQNTEENQDQFPIV